MNTGEGQAGQASKYLALRIIRRLGERSSSIEKWSSYGFDTFEDYPKRGAA
jgi:hypothetical protein